MSSKGKIKTIKNILSERENFSSEKLETNCQLKLVEVTCIDCNKKFEWYAGTLRCSSCYKNKRNSYYKAKIKGEYKRKH